MPRRRSAYSAAPSVTTPIPVSTDAARQRERQHHAACRPDYRNGPRRTVLGAGERPGRGVGDRVVEQHAEGGESDRRAQIGGGGHDGHDHPDGHLRAVRHGETWMHRRKAVRQMPIPRHGQGCAGHPEDQCQQRPQCGDRRSGAHHRLQPVRARRPNKLGQRCSARTCQPLRAGHPERGHGDRGVDDQGDTEGERNRARDGARRVAHLLAEGGDARVPGEREEQQPRRLQHPVDGDIGTEFQSLPQGLTGGERRDHDRGEYRQHERDDHSGQARLLLARPFVLPARSMRLSRSPSKPGPKLQPQPCP